MLTVLYAPLSSLSLPDFLMKIPICRGKLRGALFHPAFEFIMRLLEFLFGLLPVFDLGPQTCRPLRNFGLELLIQRQEVLLGLSQLMVYLDGILVSAEQEINQALNRYFMR